MAKYQANLPVIRRTTKVVSEPLSGPVRPLRVATDRGADNLLASDYQSAGKMILEYRVRLQAANSAGEQIGYETHLKLEGPESLQLAASISPFGGAHAAPPSRDDLGHPAEKTFAQRLAELNLKLVRQLADLTETGRLMKAATEQVARAMPELRQGLGDIKAKFKPIKLGDESKS